MKIKDCAIKYSRKDIWLHPTAGGYRVRMDPKAVETLRSMLARTDPHEMTENEGFIYRKLKAQGIISADTGREKDRVPAVKTKSSLDSIELEFSGVCNLKCAHCFSSLSGKNMDEKTLDKVFQGLDELEPVNLVISGGEPLMNPLLPRAIEGARKRDMRVSLMTNAVLVTRETAAMFKSLSVAKVMVSLDFFEDTHDAIRGAGAFGKAVAGIKRVVAEKVPVFVTAMVQGKTAGRIDDFKKFCLSELGASGVRFSAVMPIGRGKESSEELGIPDMLLKRLFRKGALEDMDAGSDAFARLSTGGYFNCNAGVGQCFVSADGNVYACHYFQNLGEPMGLLAEMSLAEIYKNNPAVAVASGFDWNGLKECRACPAFAVCKGGCRARAKILAGGWFRPDPFSCRIYNTGFSLLG
ncbi:MAG: radical SAM protein [Elusimicrobiales bacterium]|jgi:radical SAM protein with 4Fe4S-binding SPASM domain